MNFLKADGADLFSNRAESKNCLCSFSQILLSVDKHKYDLKSI